MTRHRSGERRAFLYVLPNLKQNLLEVLVVLLLGQDFETLHERESGVYHDGELAREDGEFLGLDLATASDFGDAYLSPLLFDGSQRDLFTAQDLA
jgi:hypothetical protein